MSRLGVTQAGTGLASLVRMGGAAQTAVEAMQRKRRARP